LIAMRNRFPLTLLALNVIVAASARGQATAPGDGTLDFGSEGLSFPPAVVVNAHTPRTAQLLGEAYRRNDPVVWKRVQYIADLGQVALPAAAPYLLDAMKDPSPLVRAQAARSAAMVRDASLASGLERLLTDPDPTVRREAVLSVSMSPSSALIARALDDPDRDVIRAALDVASTNEDAQRISTKLRRTLPPDLQAQAALALGRLKATAHASDVVPLLRGDVVQRVAALRALSEMGDPAQASAVLDLLDDPHPTVRREAVAAMAKLADASTRQNRAIRMLADPDLTVRQAAAEVLAPMSSPEALAALAAQLGEDYAPLHAATRAALVCPANPEMRQATIRLAAAMLSDANPRRREDACYVLGRFRSDAAIEQHIALIKWDPASSADRADWPLIAQAAESLGLIGDARAIDPLMGLVQRSPGAMANVGSRERRDQMARAMANALVAAARLHHRPALPEAVRILQIDPGECPRALRAAAAFAIGVLAEPGGKAPEAGKMLEIYASVYEDPPTKFEALKALGNLHHAPAAEKLKTIVELQPATDLRWIAHWASQRCGNAPAPYTPPTQRREPPVSISELR
jgi:HEAT repeat protein